MSEIEASGAVHLGSAEQARQLAEARQSQIMQKQGITVVAPTSPVFSNPSYSPSLYAQAAQYQLYTQSGALAWLTQQGLIAVQQASSEETDEIKSVEPPGESNGSFDALA